MQFEPFVMRLFMAILCGGATLGITFLSKISSKLSDLDKKLAVIIEKNNQHEKEIDDHSFRLNRLERKPFKVQPNGTEC